PPGGPASVGIRTHPAIATSDYLWESSFIAPLSAGSDYATPTTATFPNPVYTDGSKDIVNPADFVPVDMTVSFPGGRTRIGVTLRINKDRDVEFNEDFLVEIVPLANNPPVGPQNFSTVTILCDDEPAKENPR